MTQPTETRRRVVRVADDQARGRLDKVLSEALTDLSRSRVKAVILDGGVRIAGETVTDPSYRVKPADSIEITLPEITPAAPAAQAIDLDVVYEDADLIVINKPAGLVVHPAPGNPDRTLVNALIAHCGPSLSGIGGVARPGIVHRLDKDTSGLMVAAKTDRAHRCLARQFADHSLDRAYLAVVWGVPAKMSGEITGNIGRNPRNRKKMAVVARGGKPALTRWRVKEVLAGRASLVECILATGRTHQIRVHLAAIGHPVVGDKVYGRRFKQKLQLSATPFETAAAAMTRHALHAYLIGFRHPARSETLRFETELPIDIKKLLESGRSR